MASFLCYDFRMNPYITFNYKQTKWLEWCVTHLPCLHYDAENSGMLQDPFTKKYLAGVFYFHSSKLILWFVDIITWILADQSAKDNEQKCLKYGLLEMSE